MVQERGTKDEGKGKGEKRRKNESGKVVFGFDEDQILRKIIQVIPMNGGQKTRRESQSQSHFFMTDSHVLDDDEMGSEVGVKWE